MRLTACRPWAYDWYFSRLTEIGNNLIDQTVRHQQSTQVLEPCALDESIAGHVGGTKSKKS